MVERKHGVSAAEVEQELERLVGLDSSSVVKVEYKGSTSYRNASKFKKSHLSGNVLNSSEVSNAIIQVVDTLWSSPTTASDTQSASTSSSAQQQPQKAVPVPFSDIEKLILDQNQDSKLFGEKLREALGREVDAKRITRTSEGNYVPTNNRPTFEAPTKSAKPKRKVSFNMTNMQCYVISSAFLSSY